MGEQLTVERDGKNLNIRTDGTFRSKEEWYRNFTYDEEKIRGYANSEEVCVQVISFLSYDYLPQNQNSIPLWPYGQGSLHSCTIPF